MLLFATTAALLVTTLFAFLVVSELWLGAGVPPEIGARGLSPERPHADARVLFCEPNGPSLTVDCALLGGDLVDLRRTPVGTPFALRLRAPETAMFSEVTTAILCSWADDERIIELEVSADGRRAALDDGDTRLLLDLENSFGVAA